MRPDTGVHRYADPLQLADALASAIGAQLSQALALRGKASLVVPGGRTPLPLFQRLGRLAIDWSRVCVTLTDERWVAPEDASSNEGLLRRELLREAAVTAHFQPLKNDAATPVQGADLAWQGVAAMPRPFDVVLLGMGEDGHTASLFPGSPQIEAALDPRAEPGCVAMRAPVAPVERLSLNLSALTQTRQLYLHFTGEAKWLVCKQAETLPIGVVLSRCATPPQLYWSP